MSNPVDQPPPRRPAAGNARRQPAVIKGPGSVRLIAGRWRGTRLPVAAVGGLRPTSDRVRETLFNWLAPMLPGARVLDLFAGTGALGLEAVSRGAASAVLVERDPSLVASLRATVERLPGGDAVTVRQGSALDWLARQPDGAFDLAFVDPPFADDLWAPVLAGLLPKLSAGAWLYLESPLATAPQLPTSWPLHREGKTRDVRYALYRCHLARAAAPAATLALDPAGDGAAPSEQDA